MATATATEANPHGKLRKLQPDTIVWDLDGGDRACDGSDACLSFEIVTDGNPGNRNRGRREVPAIYEPTSCGPLVLNYGAAMVDAAGSVAGEPTLPLVVATCDDSYDAETSCEGEKIDADGDGWTVSCGDCDDDVTTGGGAYPGAEEVCDGVDNDVTAEWTRISSATSRLTRGGHLRPAGSAA